MNPNGLRTTLIAPVLLLTLAAGTGWSRFVRLIVRGAEQGCTAQPDAVATFVDPSLEAAVRGALSLGPAEELTCRRVSSLAELTAEDAGIQDLRGIENLTGLTELHLDGNAVTDLGPLSGLTSLTMLYLWGGSVNDLGPLRSLEALTVLHIGNNSVSDISPLGGLGRLRDLSITHNAVTDLGPLSGLTELEVLRVYNNPISDIEALRGLTKLTELHIHDLPQLSNIQPLLENTGLGEGDRVILMRSDISCADAAALQANGVSVSSGCLAGFPIKWWGLLAMIGGVAAALAITRHRRAQRLQSHQGGALR
jgi:Leucine-rich repeat (LRR) protein